MANDVRRDVNRIGREVGRIGRCVGHSSGCFQSLWSLAGLVAQSLWVVVNQLICMILTFSLQQLKYQKAMLTGESFLPLFIANIIFIFLF